MNGSVNRSHSTDTVPDNTDDSRHENLQSSPRPSTRRGSKTKNRKTGKLLYPNFVYNISYGIK